MQSAETGDLFERQRGIVDKPRRCRVRHQRVRGLVAHEHSPGKLKQQGPHLAERPRNQCLGDRSRGDKPIRARIWTFGRKTEAGMPRFPSLSAHRQHNLAYMHTCFHARVRCRRLGQRKCLVHHGSQFSFGNERPDGLMNFVSQHLLEII